MAKSTITNGKVDNVAQFPAADSAVAVAETPNDIESSVPAAFSEPKERNKGGRPRKTDPPVETNFFVRVAEVPPEDWGTRVYLYLYQLEPVCDLKQSGGKAYLMRYEEPVRDEHQIMLEQGSGKYRLMLSKNKTGPEASNAIAQYNFEIYNPQYPPRIPQEVWVKDPRNRRWEALLPKPAPPAAPVAPSPASSVKDFVDVLRATNDIRRDIREEMQPPPAAPVVTPPPAPPVAQPDTFSAGIQIAQTLLQMRADNPVVDMMRDEMKAMRDEIRAEREANRQLQTELRQSQQQAQQHAAPPPQKSMAEQLKELMDLKTLMGSLFGAPADAGATIRPGKMGWLDFASEVLPRVMDAPIMNALATRIMGGNPAPANGAQPAQPMPSSADQALQFVQTVVNPAMLQHFEREDDGGDLAAWLYDGYPERLAELQAYGEARIFELYRTRAPRADWAVLTARGEPAFALFVHQFCTWRPEEDDGPPVVVDVKPSSSGVVDLDREDEEDRGS